MIGGTAMFDPLVGSDPVEAGPYRLSARIGGGGMGRVYLAYTPGGRAVAVKVVRPELAEDPEFRRRFRQEVDAARRVRGMFTAELVDADPDGEPPWLATAYVPGLSLQDAVTRHGPLPTRSVRLLVAGVAEALQSVHAAGIVHRDLKPANVLLAPDGPRVIDFGIARAVDATTLTRTGVTVGSPRFMSPEHASRGELTAAADVFALGALAVFAATGHSPFGEGPDAAVLYRVVNEPPDLDGLDSALRELAEACLDKDPARRPALDEVIRVCGAERATDGWLPAPLDHETRQRTAPAAPRPTPPRDRRTGPTVAVAVVVVVLGLAAWLLTRSHQVGGAAVAAQGITTSRAPTTTTTTTTTTTSSSAPPVVTTTPPGVTTSAVAAPKPRELLGAPDWDGYCSATGQGRAELKGLGAYSWHCSGDNGIGDDGDAVCDWTYQTQTTNRIRNFNDPNSWECWRATAKLGPLDFNAYCVLLGHAGARYDGDGTAYGWHCIGDTAGLDAQDACRQLYGSDPPISRFQNFYDKDSWECWG
ncbi:serine/threonine-protein kinase [Actinophytocola sp.]|uniref:serine/threonine-protein kinase n=1 Tax=Actinophytocola sp. TaxID=1872138 RepID=UPI00389AA712